MGIGAAVAAVVGTVANVAGSIFGGVSAQQESKSRSDLLKERGELEFLESLKEAERVGRQFEKFEKRQSLQFTKAGVELSGTPLLVLEETRQERREQIAAIERGGRAAQRFATLEARAERRRGRNALISSFFEAGSAITSSFSGGGSGSISGGRSGRAG